MSSIYAVNCLLAFLCSLHVYMCICFHWQVSHNMHWSLLEWKKASKIKRVMSMKFIKYSDSISFYKKPCTCYNSRCSSCSMMIPLKDLSSKYLQKFCATKTFAEDFLSFPYNTLVSITPFLLASTNTHKLKTRE